MAITIENNYEGDGSTVLFSFTFPYIDREDVYVSIDGADTTEYTFATATQIQMKTAPANGTKVRIYRLTDTDGLKATFFPGSSIRAQDLNDNFTQTLYVTQESDFQSNTAENDAKEALAAANAAQASANQAAQDASDAADDAAQAQSDASTALSQVSTAQSAATSAQTSATEAQAQATQAGTSAAQAKESADEATEIAQEALDAIGDGPVQTVNGQQGVVVLTTEDLENDSGYITSADAPINNIDISALPVLPNVEG